MRRLNLLFDLDGTLTDSREGITNCIRFALDELGIPRGAGDDYNWCIGPPLQKSFARILGGANQHLVPEVLDLYRKRYRETGMFENKLYEGIKDCLAELVRDHYLYVVTSKLAVFSNEIIRHFALDRYFGAVYGSELDGRNTDKGQLIGDVLKKENLRPETAVMIGDREHDMAGAGKNGVAGVGVGWGYGSKEELFRAGAETVLENPGSLPEYFRNCYSSRALPGSKPGAPDNGEPCTSH